jgi:hypothetical protein
MKQHKVNLLAHLANLRIDMKFIFNLLTTNILKIRLYVILLGIAYLLGGDFICVRHSRNF